MMSALSVFVSLLVCLGQSAPVPAANRPGAPAAPAPAAKAPATTTPPAVVAHRPDASSTLPIYSPERPAQSQNDVVLLKSGERMIGRAIEWADGVRVYDAVGGFRTVPATGVDEIRSRPSATPTTAPTLPDLTVAYVERNPTATGVGPTPIRLVVHVRNAGGAPAASFGYRLFAGGKPLAEGRVEKPLAPGADSKIEATWTRTGDGGAELRVELDPGGNDAVHWNNTYAENLDAVSFVAVIHPDVAATFTRGATFLESWSFEDYVQYHVRLANALFAGFRGPLAPAGIAARVRLNGIIANAAYWDVLKPMAERRAALGLAATDTTPLIEIGASVPAAAPRGARVDWSLFAQIAKSFGLVSLEHFDIPIGRMLLRDAASGAFIQAAYRAPRPSDAADVPASYLFDVNAFYLNRTWQAASRASGEQLFDLPKACALRFVDPFGRPLPGVDVSVLQRNGTSDTPPEALVPSEGIYIGESDANGRFPLPPRDVEGRTTPNGYKAGPNPWGAIAEDGSNGVFCIRLRKQNQDEYHFVSILDFNRAAAGGQRDAFELTIQTCFSSSGAPPAPTYVRLRAASDSSNDPSIVVTFPTSRGGSVDEYRIFARVGRGQGLWTLIDQWPANRFGSRPVLASNAPSRPIRTDAAFRLAAEAGVSYAVAAADAAGNQGPLSPAGFYPPPTRRPLKLAIDPEGGVYFTQEGPLDNGIVKTDMGSFHADYGIRTLDFPGYEPWGGGIAFDNRGRMLMTDPHNHQLAWYEKGNLIKLVGNPARSPDAASKKPGEFNAPSDVVVTENGQIVVADTGNDRIQLFDEEGAFKMLLGGPTDDPEMFKAPRAVAAGFGLLCATDNNGERVQVFNAAGAKPELSRVFRGLRNADRAAPGESGRIYVLGEKTIGKPGILVYPAAAPTGGEEVPEREMNYTIQGEVRGPRGLYPDGKRFGFYITEFPFIVQRLMLE